MPTAQQQMATWTKNMKKAIAKSLNKGSMQDLGELVVDTIVARTRYKGQGVDKSGGRADKLDRVSDKYAAWRKKQKRHPDAAKGKKSNLTFSGDMLDSVAVTSAKQRTFEVGFNDDDEAKKAKGNAERGRPFLHLTGREINLITKELNTKIKQNVKKV